jgi:hypothetical protein
MNRRKVIELFAERVQAKTYLEIGIRTAETIAGVQVRSRIGVDPSPKIAKRVTIQRWFKGNKFQVCRMTSDHFFNTHAADVLCDGIDIALIDGLHTYGQSLRDVENALKYLNNHGMIIMHDCNPASELHAYPVAKSIDELKMARKADPQKHWPKAWNGDVWKALWHLRCTHPELNIFTLNCDHGLGIVLKRPAGSKAIDADLADCNIIAQTDYHFLNDNRERILNLKSSDYMLKVLASVI